MTGLIGVAIEIPQPWSHELTSWRAKVGDPQAESVPPHITLLPPTPLPAGGIDEVEAHLAGVAAAHSVFDLRLAGTGTFRPVSEVVFVTVAGGAGECARLEGDVRSGPLRRDTDFPYHPHVTIAQGLAAESLDRAAEGLAGFAAGFAAEAFLLYTHGGDRRWHPRRSFALGAGA